VLVQLIALAVMLVRTAVFIFEEKSFRSGARVFAQGLREALKDGANSFHPMLQNPMDYWLWRIGSPEFRERVDSRMRSVHPRVQARPCVIDATNPAHTSFIFFSATSPHETYAQDLDAVVDEFLQWRREAMRPHYEVMIRDWRPLVASQDKKLAVAEQRIKEAKEDGASPDDLIGPEKELREMKTLRDKWASNLRTFEERLRKDDGGFAILQRASMAEPVVPLFTFFRLL